MLIEGYDVRALAHRSCSKEQRRYNLDMQGCFRSLLFALPLIAAPPVFLSASDTHAADEETMQVVDVKIELGMENGKVVKHLHTVTALGIDHTVTFKGEKHDHAVLLNVDGVAGKMSKLNVRLGYDRDGVAIIAPFESEFKAKKRDAMWTDDGKIAIALTFKPKKVKKDTNKRGKDRVDPGAGDAPMG